MVKSNSSLEREIDDIILYAKTGGVAHAMHFAKSIQNDKLIELLEVFYQAHQYGAKYEDKMEELESSLDDIRDQIYGLKWDIQDLKRMGK
jgi:hypothetical protein